MASLPLPSDMKKTIEIYKLQSQKVQQWVITTAGELNAAKPPPSTPQKTSGKKKRNRKNASKASRANPYSPKTTFLAFITNIDTIVAAGIPIPTEILACLANVIEFRKIAAAFFSSDLEAWKENKGHYHAISVFVLAFQKLGGKTGVESTRKKGEDYLASAGNAPATEDGKPSFLKAELAMQRVEKTGKPGTLENEWLRDNPMINRNNQSPKPQQKTFPLEDYEITDDDVENGPDAALLAVIGFFCDMAKIRGYCKSVWKQVEPVGKISRVSASLVTTQATELVKKLERELKAEYPRNITSDVDIYTLVVPYLVKLEKEPDVSAVAEEGLMIRTWRSLRDFTSVIQDGHVPVTKEGFFGHYNPKNQRRQMNAQQKKEEDRCVLMNYLPEMCLLFSASPEPKLVSLRPPHEFIGDDGFGMEFKPYYKGRTHPITMSLVFSAQMVLDILYTRRDAGIDDHKAMLQFYKKITGEMDEILTHPHFTPPDNLMNFNNAMHGRRELLDAEMGTDFVTSYKIAKGWHKLSPVEKNIVWTRNPWLTANAMTYALSVYWDLGASLCLGANFPQSVIELWNFLKQLGYLDEFISDHPAPETLIPEYLISKFSNVLFTRGHVVTDNFALQSFMQNGTQKPAYNLRPGDSLTGTGINPHISDIYEMYISRNGLATELARINRTHVKSRSEQASAGTVSAETSTNPLLEAEEHTLLYPLASTLKLAQSELRDNPVIGLDGFLMHNKCYAFLQRLWDEEKSGICAAMGQKEAEVLERTNQLPYLPLYLMVVVFAKERKGENVRTMPLLKRVAKLVGEVVGGWKVGDFVLKV